MNTNTLNELTKNIDKMVKESLNGVYVPSNDKFFLSVIVISKGDYLRLMDTLMCFCGQENENFEVLLMCNRNEEIIDQALKDIPECVLKKTTCIKDKKTKGELLNIGTKQGKGTHISIVNEGDLLLPNWVAKFANNAQFSQIIYGYYLSENMKNDDKRSVNYDLTSIKPYNYFAHTKSFISCISAYAFNANVFKTCSFNEELIDYPEWEFLAKVAFVFKVKNVREAVAVSRIWNDEKNLDEIEKIARELGKISLVFNGEEVDAYAKEEVFCTNKISDTFEKQSKNYLDAVKEHENLTKTNIDLYDQLLSAANAHKQADLAYTNINAHYEETLSKFNRANEELEKIKNALKDEQKKANRIDKERRWLLLYKDILTLKTSKNWEKTKKSKQYKQNTKTWEDRNVEQMSEEQLHEYLNELKRIVGV